MPTPPFVLELREVWGHRPLLLIGVVGVVVRSAAHPDEHQAGDEPRVRSGDESRDEMEILLTRRADTGRWALPAGILEPGEQPGATLLRELREETTIEARIDRLALVRTDPPVIYPNRDQVQYLTLCFRATHLRGSASVGDDESLEVGWFARDRLPELGPGQVDRIAAALDESGPTRFA